MRKKSTLIQPTVHNSLPLDLTLLGRLFNRIQISTTHFYKGTACWEWQGAVDKDGYGKTYYQKDGYYKDYRVHRLFYDLFIEIIPSHLVTDHLCRNVLCCNPIHLEAVTQKENTLRGNAISALNAQKTHCLRGHLFTPENCLPRKNGKRDCRTCANMLKAQRRAIRKSLGLPYQ